MEHSKIAERLVVIGGTAAGLSAASKAKRNRPELQVTVFEKTGYTSYGSCGLPYFVGGTIPRAEDLITLTPEELNTKRGIRALVRHQVLGIHREDKTVLVEELETGRTFREPYDKLVIATGALPFMPPIKGKELEGVHVLRCVEDGLGLRRAVEQGASRTVVVGGGLIGLETAEQLSISGLSVEVVEAAPRLLGFLPEEYAVMVGQVLRENGVGLRLDTTVREITHHDGVVTGVVTHRGETIPADLVLVAAGAVPNTALARDCGLKQGLKGGIVVDGQQRTSDSSIWACGDCVEMKHLLTGAPCYFPLGTTANKQGKVAGDSVTGKEVSFPGVLGSQVTKVFSLYVASTGLNGEQARSAGFDPESCAVTKSDRASYYPGGINTHLTLVFDKGSGRLLGAQGVGGESVAGRMNVLVTAIGAGMTVKELGELDLVYSPSVAPVYDPLLIAASQAAKMVKG